MKIKEALDDRKAVVAVYLGIVYDLSSGLVHQCTVLEVAGVHYDYPLESSFAQIGKLVTVGWLCPATKEVELVMRIA